MIFGRKIELKVYVNKYDSVSDIQTPSRSLAFLCFLHELLTSFRMQIMAKRYKYIKYIPRVYIERFTVHVDVVRINIDAFCLRIRENRSLRLQMADLSGVVSFVMVFKKNMDRIFVRSLRNRVNSTQVRVLVLLQFNFLQNS
jgi:hypothetical protein